MISDTLLSEVSNRLFKIVSSFLTVSLLIDTLFYAQAASPVSFLPNSLSSFCNGGNKMTKLILFYFNFFVFLPFLGLLPQYMVVPRLGV